MIRIILFLCLVVTAGCSATKYHKVSVSDIGERVDDITQQRIKVDEILVHIQPRNEVKYKESMYIGFIPVHTKEFDKRLTRKWPPFRVEFFVYAKNNGYSFTPKDIKLSVNGQESIQPLDVSGPLNRTENIPGWSISLDETLGRIICKTHMSEEVISRDVSTEIKLSERGWLCYELYFDIAVPLPTDDIVITVGGMKKNGKKLSFPTVTYHEGEYVQTSF